jgi:hypothetical protein
MTMMNGKTYVRIVNKKNERRSFYHKKS